MTIVENSYYDHTDYGLVKVVKVDDGTVFMEKQEEAVKVNGVRIPSGVKQTVENFEKNTSPGDVSVSANAAEFNLTGRDQ